MRKGPKVKFTKDGEGNFDFSCDWRDTPGDVMEAVHIRLKEFGLEVFSHESDGDFEGFSIRPIKKKK